MLDRDIWISTLRMYAPEFNDVDLSSVETYKAIIPNVDPTNMQFSFKTGTLKETCGYPCREYPHNSVLTVSTKNTNHRLVEWAQSNRIKDNAVINRVLTVAAEPTVSICDIAFLTYEKDTHEWWVVLDRNSSSVSVLEELVDFDDEHKLLIIKENKFSRSVHTPKKKRHKTLTGNMTWHRLYRISEEFARYLYRFPITRLYVDEQNGALSVYIVTSEKLKNRPRNLPKGWTLTGSTGDIFKFEKAI